jgi:phage gpG-like protein
MSGASGDFAELDELAKKFAGIGGSSEWAKRFRDGLFIACAEAAHYDALDQEFISGIDPYGKPWKSVQRGGVPLNDTGRLASSWSHGITENGFYVETNVYYARTHQLGAGVPGSPIGVIKPVEAKALSWVGRNGQRYFRKEVTIPRRQQVPQPDTGGMGNWAGPVNDAADDFMREWFK